MSRQQCPYCPHPEDDHIVAAAGDPVDGGTFFCPVKGCECVGSWYLRGRTVFFTPEPVNE